MTNDIQELRAKTQEFIAFGEDMQKKSWNIKFDDVEAFLGKGQGIIVHIADLQKRLDEYEARIERLEDESVSESDGTDFARGLFSGLRLAIEIMTGEDKG